MTCYSNSRRMLLCFVALLTLCTNSAPGTPQAAKLQVVPDAAPVRLAVIMTVDGLSWSRLTAYAPWFTSGLKRLLTEGQVESECRFAHLNTDTGPGHASLACGAPPRVTGIVTEHWLEQNGQGNWSLASCTDQPWAPAPGAPPLYYKEVTAGKTIVVFAIEFQYQDYLKLQERGIWIMRDNYGPKGETVFFDSEDAKHLYNLRHGKPQEPIPTGIMPGARKVRTHTLGDMFMKDHPSSHAIALSGTETGAVFMAGKNRDLYAYWYDEGSGRLLTSGAYDVSNSSKIAVRRGIMSCSEQMAGKALAQRYGTWWRKLPPPERTSVSLPMPMTGMWDFQLPTLGLGFDHDLARFAGDIYHGVAYSPVVDEFLTDCAVSLLSDDNLKIGQESFPDLLMLSYSGVDQVFHAYGGESEEGLEALRRLDLQIGRVLTLLEEKVGRDKVIVALASPHGMAPIPEVEKRKDGKKLGGRVVVGDRALVDFVARLNGVLDAELCLDAKTKPVAALDGWNLYYNQAELPRRVDQMRCPDGMENRIITAKELDAVLKSVVRRNFDQEIAEVFLTSEMKRWPPSDSLYQFARENFDPERSGNAILIPREGVLLTRDPGRGTGHGSYYDYDLHVPLIFWGSNVVAKTSSEPTTPYDLAPTLANYLATTMPEATGKALFTPASDTAPNIGQQK